MMHDKVAVLPQNASVPMTHRKTCVLVLGMHRSGTSAIARVLNLLGCDLPKTLMPAGKGNETGHWESHPIAQFNDRLLASAASSWDDWLAVNPGWFSSPRAAQFQEEALSLLETEFGGSRLFVLKDPRICRLVPFWLNVLAANGTAARIILPVRNPLEVAMSLASRDGMEPALGHLLWLRHALEAEHATRGRERVFTSYDRLLRNWGTVTAEAAEALQMTWPRQSVRVEAEVLSFLDRKRRHHEEAIEDTITNPHLSGWLRNAFRVFSEWAIAGEKQQDIPLLDRIRAELDAAAPAFTRLVLAGREAALRSARLQAEQKALTDRLQAGEHTIAGLRSELEKAEKAFVSQAERVFELETAVRATEDRLSAQEGVVTTLSAERDSLSRAFRAAEEAHRNAVASLEEAARRARTETQAARATERDLSTALADAHKSVAELTLRVADAEDWIYRLSADRAMYERQLSAQSAKLVQIKAREETLVARNAELELRAETAQAELATLREQLSDREIAIGEARNTKQLLEAARAAAEALKATHATELAKAQAARELLEKVRSTDLERSRAAEKALEEARAAHEASKAAHAAALEEAKAAKKSVEWRLSERFDEIAALTDALRGAESSARAAELELAEARATAQRSQDDKRAMEEQLANRFNEIARLARIVGEVEAAKRGVEAERDWLREAALILSNGSRSVKGRLSGFLPAAWRRTRQLRQLKARGLFDLDAYLAANADVRQSNQDGLRHYIRHGLSEGRPVGEPGKAQT